MSELARAIQVGLEALSAGDTSRALKSFSIAIEAASDGTVNDRQLRGEALRRRGLLYLDLGRAHDAITDLTRSIELNSADAQAFQSRALVRLSLRNPMGAVADLEAAIALDDLDPRSHQLAGIAQRRCSQIDAAIASFTRAARLYLHRGDKENGRQCLAQIDPLRPRTPSQSSTINPAHSDNSTNPASSGSSTDQSLKTNPTPVFPHTSANNVNLPSPSDFYRQMIERAESGDAAAALRDLDWVLKSGDLDPEALCCRAAIYSTLGRFQDALADFNRVIKSNERLVMAYGGRGRARLRLGDIGGAIADLNRAIELDDTEPDLWVTRGVAYRDSGNYSGALAEFGRAIELDASCAKAYLERGTTYARQEDLIQAAEDYQQAASLFCEQEAWDAYKAAIGKVAKLRQPRGFEGHETVRSSEPSVDKSSVTNSETSTALLKQTLLRLVGGHWEIAERLLAQARDAYPGLNEEGYLRQVIAEIEGDGLG